MASKGDPEENPHNNHERNEEDGGWMRDSNTGAPTAAYVLLMAGSA
jgi:hypothetical protein